MPGVQALDAQRAPAFSFDPRELVMPNQPDDDLYDPRVEGLPVTREDVLLVISQGAAPIEVRKRDKETVIVDGKQRNKAMIVANVLGAGCIYKGPVKSVRAAIDELSKDEEFVQRVRSLMKGRQMRIRAVAANAGDSRDSRIKMRARNRSHQDTMEERIKWAQEEHERWGTSVDDIADAEGETVQTVRRWLSPTTPKPRKPRGPSARPAVAVLKKVLADGVPELGTLLKIELGPRERMLLRMFVEGVNTVGFREEFPTLAKALEA